MAMAANNQNLRKLQTILKKVNFPLDSDIKDGITQGLPSAYFPIYHYMFVNYSQPFAQKINEKNIELAGKTDLRFFEAIYRILRDMFNYKPPLTKDQFFSSGFVEKKIIMCTDIIQLVQERHLRLQPAKVKQFKVPAAFGYGGTVGMTRPDLDTNDKLKKTASLVNKPKAVNERKNLTSKYSIRSFNTSTQSLPGSVESSISHSKTVVKGKRGFQKRTPNSKVAAKATSYHDWPDVPKYVSSPISVREQLEQEIASSVMLEDDITFEHVEAEAVETTFEIPFPDGVPDESQNPIDIVAMTPGNTVQSLRMESTPVTDNTKELIKDFDLLKSQLLTLTSRVSELEASKKECATCGKSLMENLEARMTILENKVAMLQVTSNQVSTASADSPKTSTQNAGLVQGVPVYNNRNDSLTHSPPVKDLSSVLSPISVNAKDNLPADICSPEPSIFSKHDQGDTRSSTPEDKSKQDSSLSLHYIDTATSNQAKRIAEMIQETENLIKDENEPPEQ